METETKEYPMPKEFFDFMVWMLDPKAIDGALKSCIHAHGPIVVNNKKYYPADEINRLFVDLAGQLGLSQDDMEYMLFSKYIGTSTSTSASKRIRGAMKTRAAEYFEKKKADQAMAAGETLGKFTQSEPRKNIFQKLFNG